MVLDELALKYDTDKSSRSHWYTHLYERMIGPYRASVEHLLEIGVGSGASIRMWMEYFPDAFIYGVDQNQVGGDFGGRVTFFQCEQTDGDCLRTHFTGIHLDVIVDDCSHEQQKTMGTLKILYPLLSHGGWYVIEDMNREFIEPLQWALNENAREVHALRDKDGCNIIFIRK